MQNHENYFHNHHHDYEESVHHDWFLRNNDTYWRLVVTECTRTYHIQCHQWPCQNSNRLLYNNYSHIYDLDNILSPEVILMNIKCSFLHLWTACLGKSLDLQPACIHERLGEQLEFATPVQCDAINVIRISKLRI